MVGGIVGLSTLFQKILVYAIKRGVNGVFGHYYTNQFERIRQIDPVFVNCLILGNFCAHMHPEIMCCIIVAFLVSSLLTGIVYSATKNFYVLNSIGTFIQSPTYNVQDDFVYNYAQATINTDKS